MTRVKRNYKMQPPKKHSNKHILTRNKNKRRTDKLKNPNPEIVWNSKSRTYILNNNLLIYREYLTGFENRNKKKTEKSIERYQNELKELKRERLREVFIKKHVLIIYRNARN